MSKTNEITYISYLKSHLNYKKSTTGKLRFFSEKVDFGVDFIHPLNFLIVFSSTATKVSTAEKNP